MTGMRQGELLGLTWEDTDGSKLHIRQALTRGPAVAWSWGR